MGIICDISNPKNAINKNKNICLKPYEISLKIILSYHIWSPYAIEAITFQFIIKIMTYFKRQV